MMCYPPTGYIICNLKKLKFYEGRAPGAGQPRHGYEKT